MTSGLGSKVALIGVDAAEISYIRENLSALPNFRNVLEHGWLSDLHSQAGLITGCVWPCFFTESPPGEHGFYGHLAWDPQEMRLRRVTRDWLPMEPFWRDLASQGGFDVVAADVPMAFAPRSGPGIEIAGWGTHDGLSSFVVNPHPLANEILRRFGVHPMGLEIPVNKTPAERTQIKRKMIEGALLKAELTKWLIATQRWDLLFVVFGELHRAGHILWPLDDSISPYLLLEVYRAVDCALGEILSCLRPYQAKVAVFSLHGMGPNNSQEHFTQKIMGRINAHFSASEGSTASAAPSRRFSHTHALRERLPPRFQTAIAMAVPQWARDLVVDRSYTGGFDWKRTPAIALRGDRNGYIRLNIRGREREGMLEPDSSMLRRYVSGLREGFNSFRTEFGDPLVEEIQLAAEVAPGKRTHYLPDIIVTWKEAPRPATRINSPVFGEIVAQSDTGRTGHHRAQGFLVMLEQSSQKGRSSARQMSVNDLASIIRARLSGQPSGVA
jgi:predicted AlkP superfamily phosphohydrolase/phosphomutase